MSFLMPPAAAISLLCALCSFLLKTSVAYGCCWLLARCATSATRRFTVWFLYLLGTAAYWIYSLVELFSVPRIAQPTGSHPAPSRLGLAWVVPTHLTRDIVLLSAALIVVYAAALIITAGFGLWRRLQLYRALRLRHAPPKAVAQVFQSVAEDMHLSQCDLWVLPGLTSPATLGTLHAAIYLPADCEEQDEVELNAVLRHELKHVKRMDSLWEMVSRTCRFLLCFHPLVHRAFAATRFEREVACDMAVVRSCPDKRDRYAETLVRFGWKAAVADRPDYIGIGFTSAAAVLNARVRWILKGEEIYSTWSRKGRAIVSAGVLWLFVAATPALWVAFSLAPLPQSTVIGSLQQQTLRAVARHASSHLVLRSTAPSLVAAVPTVVSTTNPSRSVDDMPHYHIQNADEPMSNPVASDELQGNDANWQRDKSGPNSRSVGPSATSVIIDTATQLGRMGVGGHEHEHD